MEKIPLIYILEHFMNSIIFLMFIVIIIFLQIFLSKRKSKVPGLVLPIIILLCSLNSFTLAYNFIEGVKFFILVNVLTAILILIYITNQSILKVKSKYKKF